MVEDYFLLGNMPTHQVNLTEWFRVKLGEKSAAVFPKPLTSEIMEYNKMLVFISH